MALDELGQCFGTEFHGGYKDCTELNNQAEAHVFYYALLEYGCICKSCRLDGTS